MSSVKPCTLTPLTLTPLIGNRTSATHGGTGTAVTYTPNALNQYTNIATEGGRFILGEAPAANAVTVNSLTAARAGGLGFYWKQITASNSTAPLWSNDSVVSNGVTVTGRTWTPAATVASIYDEDGNLKSDGRWDYLWDAENRLIQMKATTAALAAATASGIPCQKLDFAYDSQGTQGRRVSKTVATSTNGTTWTFASNQRFLYDGWNMIAEYSAPSATATSLTLQATHTWGTDLSGSLRGAGGVDGLLATHLVGAPVVACYPAYDGNGNISAWIDGTGTLLGRMDYSPFGQLIAQYRFTPVGNTTLSRLGFGFSTKYTDAETGLLYYGYRYYDPVNGRWPSRGPIRERGGVHLYGFISNRPANLVDILGLRPLGEGERGVVASLKGHAKSVSDSNPKLSAALDATAKEYEELILGLKDEKDPVRVNLTNAALDIWNSLEKAKVFNFTGTYMCSAFVRRSMSVGGIKSFGDPNAATFTNGGNMIGKAKLDIVYELRYKDQSGVEISGVKIANAETLIEWRSPKMGDIISYGVPGFEANSSHVGIYLGNGVFVSATTTGWPSAVGIGDEQMRGNVMIKFIPESVEPSQKIIFRSVD